MRAKLVREIRASDQMRVSGKTAGRLRGAHLPLGTQHFRDFVGQRLAQPRRMAKLIATNLLLHSRRVRYNQDIKRLADAALASRIAGNNRDPQDVTDRGIPIEQANLELTALRW